MTTLRRRRAVVLTAAVLPLAVALAACGKSTKTYPPATPPQAGLAIADSITKPIKIGVVVTTTSAPGEGQDDLGPAAGARVAEYRLGLAKAGIVTLDVEDDHGTAAGAKAAVQKLVSDGVVGVVYASEGSHVDAGVAVAQAAHLAVLLPYDTDLPSGTGVYLTGPTTQQVVDTLSKALAAQDLTRPVVVSTQTVDGLAAVQPAATTVSVASSSSLGGQVSAAITKVGTSTGPDAVVAWGSAGDEAATVAAVQRQSGNVGSPIPTYLGPSALSSAFAQSLTSLGSTGTATTAGTYVTAGLNATDNTSTPAMQAFLQALRLAAADTSEHALASSASFDQDGAATADARSHDAVLALVDAVVTAKSTDPAAVESALATLSVPTSIGLAGPALDFHQPAAVSDADVVALQATTQSPGLRTGVQETAPGLTWFAVGAAPTTSG